LTFPNCLTPDCPSFVPFFSGFFCLPVTRGTGAGEAGEMEYFIYDSKEKNGFLVRPLMSGAFLSHIHILTTVTDHPMRTTIT